LTRSAPLNPRTRSSPRRPLISSASCVPARLSSGHASNLAGM
jgi:hypothetical protein